MLRGHGTAVLVAIGVAACAIGWSGLVLTGSAAAPPASLREVSVTAVNRQGAALAQTIHDAAGLALLQEDLQRLLPRPAAGGFPCPADDGSYYRVTYAYRGGGTLLADVRRTGCEAVSIPGRGAPTLTWSDPALLRDLDSLFPPEWQSGF